MDHTNKTGGGNGIAKLFGEPNKGIHSYRVLDIAIVDVLFTVAAAAILKRFFNGWHFVLILSLLFALGICAHRAFNVRTKIDRILFPSA